VVQSVLARIGDDLAIVIPRRVAKQLSVTDRSEIDIALDQGRLMIRMLDEQPAWQLKDLLSGITDQNRHREFRGGALIGNER
jgi:antitoxin component of MazEF toxin-antitoxin module